MNLGGPTPELWADLRLNAQQLDLIDDLSVNGVMPRKPRRLNPPVVAYDPIELPPSAPLPTNAELERLEQERLRPILEAEAHLVSLREAEEEKKHRLKLIEEFELPEDWFEKTDSTITKEEISRAKKLGAPKPPLVYSEVWNEPKTLTAKHHMIAHLAVMGFTSDRIASEVEMSSSRVDRLLKSPAVKKLINDQRELVFADGKKMIQSLMQKAFGVIEHILDDEKEKGSVRLDAAKYVIDQTVGKAQQNVVLDGGNFLKDVMSKLDQAVRVIEATPVTEVDPMDALVDDIVVEGVVVGKREIS